MTNLAVALDDSSKEKLCPYRDLVWLQMQTIKTNMSLAWMQNEKKTKNKKKQNSKTAKRSLLMLLDLGIILADIPKRHKKEWKKKKVRKITSNSLHHPRLPRHPHNG